ncbi:hypothetical protein pb186bvf_008533 [Paramecium bursaria]
MPLYSLLILNKSVIKKYLLQKNQSQILYKRIKFLRQNFLLQTEFLIQRFIIDTEISLIYINESQVHKVSYSFISYCQKTRLVKTYNSLQTFLLIIKNLANNLNTIKFQEQKELLWFVFSIRLKNYGEYYNFLTQWIRNILQNNNQKLINFQIIQEQSIKQKKKEKEKKNKEKILLFLFSIQLIISNLKYFQ